MKNPLPGEWLAQMLATMPMVFTLALRFPLKLWRFPPALLWKSLLHDGPHMTLAIFATLHPPKLTPPTVTATPNKILNLRPNSIAETCVRGSQLYKGRKIPISAKKPIAKNIKKEYHPPWYLHTTYPQSCTLLV